MTSSILTKEQVESNPGTKLVLDWFKQTYGVDLPVKDKEKISGIKEANVSTDATPKTEGVAE